MGCRTRVIGNVHDPSREIVTGRGNLSFTSINLPRLAIQSDHNVGLFFEKLEEKMDLVIDQLMHRFNIQSQKRVRNYPFLMGQGIWIDSEKLSPDDTVGEVLKHGTLSVGFIGLAEALKALIGAHHGESEEARELGLEIISTMRHRLDEESQRTGLNFSLLDTPAEGLSGRFVRMDKKRYGIIEGVSDRPYVSNSFHCHVTEDVTPIEKQDLEGRFWELCNGGKIQYVRYPISYNIEAVRVLIRRAMKFGYYEGVNLSLAYCDDCGHEELEMDVCPVCGSRKLTKIDRMNGYLSYSRVHGDTRLNEAKMAEIAERKSM